MKLTIEDVQVAIKGVSKYGNTCISGKLLAVVAGNYAKVNNIITVHLQSLYEDENFDSIVGEIKNLYYSEANGQPQLRGDITFDAELLDLQSLLHSLAHGCVYLSPYFMNLGSSNYCFACLSSVTLSKAEAATFDGIEPLDISCLNGLINALYKEPAAKASAEQQDDTPYICAPGMSREQTIRWLMDVLAALGTNKEDYVSQMTDIENRKQFIHSEFNNKLEILRKAFPQLDPESILSQDRKVTLI